MKVLSEIERRVLGEITWNGRATVQELAHRLKVKSHIVRRTVSVLESALELKPRCWTDPFRQGLTSHRIYFSLRSPDPERTKKLVDYISARTEVVWFASLTGKYQLCMALRCGRNGAMRNVLADIDQLFGNIIIDKQVSTIEHFVYLIPWIAHIKGEPRRQLEIISSTQPVALGEKDRQIIEVVKRSPISSIDTMSKHCALPRSTFAYRFEQLVKEKVIIAFGFAYNERRAGFESFLIGLTTRGFSSTLFPKFHRFAVSNPNVFAIGCCLGKWDIEIAVELEHQSDLEELLSTLESLGEGEVEDIAVHTIRRTYKG